MLGHALKRIREINTKQDSSPSDGVIANDYTGAQATIQNALNQTTEPQSLQLLNLLSQQVTGKQTKVTTAATRASQMVAAQANARLQGQLAFLQNRLAQSQATHRPDGEIQALHGIISSIQAQLNSATTAPSP